MPPDSLATRNLNKHLIPAKAGIRGKDRAHSESLDTGVRRYDAVYSVHTLLRLRHIDELIWEEGRPDWAISALQLAPWVVVRRAAPRPRLWPVGIRGGLRLQRCAAWLPDTAVEDCVTPEMLVATRSWRQRPCADAIPALALLDEVEAILHAHGYAGRWGPGGSVGFELASTLPCVSPNSDLDLVLQAHEPIAVRDAAALWAALSELPARVDALLETPVGAVALAEYARGKSVVMLRTAQGSQLVADPWLVDATSVASASA